MAIYVPQRPPIQDVLGVYYKYTTQDRRINRQPSSKSKVRLIVALVGDVLVVSSDALDKDRTHLTRRLMHLRVEGVL